MRNRGSWFGHENLSPISYVLTGVSNIFSNSDAFAAVLSDGSVVTWGDPEAGGNNWDLDGLS